MLSVDSEEAARKLGETQDHNPLLDLDILAVREQFSGRAGGAQGAAREAKGDVKRHVRRRCLR
jgi:hypothetical protein